MVARRPGWRARQRRAVRARARAPARGARIAGRPAGPLDDGQVYGEDAEGRIALALIHADGRLVWKLPIRRTPDLVTGVSFANDSPSDVPWKAETAFLERWSDGRVLSVAHAHGRVVRREHYVYDGDRVVEIVQRQTRPYAGRTYEQRWTVAYGPDGPACLPAASA